MTYPTIEHSQALLEDAQSALRKLEKWNRSENPEYVELRSEWITEVYEAVSNAHYLLGHLND